MPTHALVQVGSVWDSTLPRDIIINSLCYRWANFTIQDAESLANNVLDAYDAVPWMNSYGEMHAKVYDLEGTKPVLPMASVSRRVGSVFNHNGPREVALCLSYSGGQHQPRQRGRIYLPNRPLGGTTGIRPAGSQIGYLMTLGDNLYGVGGANVDWIVWSRVNRSATSVTRHWVDDEWDTQRRRGLRSTTRNVKNH